MLDNKFHWFQWSFWQLKSYDSLYQTFSDDRQHWVRAWWPCQATPGHKVHLAQLLVPSPSPDQALMAAMPGTTTSSTSMSQRTRPLSGATGGATPTTTGRSTSARRTTPSRPRWGLKPSENQNLTPFCISAEVVWRVRRARRALLRHQPCERLQGASPSRARLRPTKTRLWCWSSLNTKWKQNLSSLFVCNHLSFEFVPFYKWPAYIHSRIKITDTEYSHR